MEFIQIAKQAKEASLLLSDTSTEMKNLVLKKISDSISNNKDLILAANKNDLADAEKLLSTNEISQAVFNRLKLDATKINIMIDGILDVIKLDDPINKCLLARELDKDLNLYKISCPIGVLGIIFEARPDVISQISALAIKSSNAVILKGGKEASLTNKAIFDAILEGISQVPDFPKNAVNLVYSRDDVAIMLTMPEYIDLIIPRGGNSLVRYIKENTKIPVLGHSDGICHIFIDESADFEMAKSIVIDAKTQYPSACNAVETLLIHDKFKHSQALLSALKSASITLIDNPETWAFEYSDTILAYKFVTDVTDAINHINNYGSGHTDAIVTDNIQNAEIFLNKVDSAGCYHNASTRFADGYRYGFGAEVGISTNKTHARGPVGLDGLTIYKYKLYGKGQIVSDYASGAKKFTHKPL